MTKRPVVNNAAAGIGDRTTIFSDPKTRKTREGIAVLWEEVPGPLEPDLFLFKVLFDKDTSIVPMKLEYRLVFRGKVQDEEIASATTVDEA